MPERGIVWGFKIKMGTESESGMTPWERRELGEEVDRMAELMRKGSDSLCLKDKPAALTQYNMLENYMLLVQPDMAESCEDAKELFEITEGQASWIVLRSFEPDDAIGAYSREERQRRFIERLYAHQDDFMFFGAREGALQNLSLLGIISSPEDYMPKQQQPHSGI